MKPETRTVNELFERDVRYVVPLYQRPYVWDEEHQWEPLWEDIAVLLDHELGSDNTSASQSHFLGAIVLEQETQAPGKIPVYTVIDGQQRLTTLQLVLAAARTAAGELSAEEDAGLLGDLVTNDPRKAKGDERLKVWPTNVNRTAFRAVLLPEFGALDDDSSNLIQEAFAFFKRRMTAWALDGEPGTEAERLATLRVTLSDLLKVVSITLEPGDNAQIIFETLNARGTPLLALDLVKNAVFHQAAREGRDIDRLYDEVWRPELDDDRWRQERRQGRLLRAQGELFLMHWLGMKLRRLIPATELFTTFRTNVLGGAAPPDTASLIRELNRDAATYRSFDRQEPGTREAAFFERLEALDVTTVMPLVLLLFTHPGVSASRRRTALETLESWLVRRMLLRLSPKNYSQQVAHLLGAVTAEPERADDVIRDHFTQATSDINRWPRDAEVIEALETRDFYHQITQARVAMVLRAIELSLYDARVDLPSVPRSLWIEHVMPQRWDEHWKLEAALDEDDLERRTAERNRRIHHLGNLTLTAMPMNISLSNKPWPEKQGKLNEATRLLLNAELLARYGPRFDEAAIDERTSLLARRICGIWRGPSSA